MAHSSVAPTEEGPREDGDDDVFYTPDKISRSLQVESNGHSSKTKTIDRYGFIVKPDMPQSPTM